MYLIGFLILIALIWYLMRRVATLESSVRQTTRRLDERLDVLETWFRQLREKEAQSTEVPGLTPKVSREASLDAWEQAQAEAPSEPVPPTAGDFREVESETEGPVVVPPPPSLPPPPTIPAAAGPTELRSEPEPDLKPVPSPEGPVAAYLAALDSEVAQAVTHRPPQSGLLRGRTPRKSFSWNDLEDLLGGNWLNRVGVGVLVMGVSLLLGYTFENLGPIGKLLIGYIVTASLLGGGIWLERKEKYNLYGKALIGGGWALGYFTTFALHFVESVRVIDQEVWGLVVLGLYTTAMISYTLRYKSELVTVLAAVLAVVTIELSSVGLFDLTAILLLTAFVVVCCTRFGWFYLGLLGAVATYGVHLQWQVSASVELYSTAFWGSLLLLGAYWLFYLAPAFFAAPRNENEGTLLQGINLVNAGFLIVALIHLCVIQDLCFSALLILGGLYVGLAALATRRRLRASYLTFSTFAAGLLIGAMAIRFTGDTLALTWLLESELLLILGLLQREKYFRILGYIGLGLSLGVLLVYGGGAGTFAIFATVLYLNRILGTSLVPEEMKRDEIAATDLFTYPAAFLAASALWKWVDIDYLAPFWALLAISLLVVGIAVAIKHIRYHGYVLLYVAAATMLPFLLGADGEAYWGQTLAVAGIVYFTSCLIRWLCGKALISRDESLVRHGYTHFGTLLATILLWKVVPDLWIAPAIAGFAVVLAEIERRWTTEHLRAQVYVLGFVAFATFGARSLGDSFSHDPLYLRWIVAGLVIFLLYSLFLQLRKRIAEGAIEGAEKYLVEALSFEAAIATAILLDGELKTVWVPAAWGVLSLVAFYMGLFTKDRHYRIKAYLLLAATVGRIFLLNLWVSAPTFDETAKIVSVVLVLLILGTWYGGLFKIVRRAVAIGDQKSIELERLVMTVVACSIGLMSAVLFYQEVPTRLLTVAWGMEALLLFAVGLWLGERDLRLLGLGFLSFCVLKVFFYDLAGLEGLPRIFSFIVLGLILLLVSYLYTRFSQTLRRYL